MYITKHAVKRFLQRVKKVNDFDKKEFSKAKNELQMLFKNVITNRIKVVVPNFSNFIAITKNNKVITILKKYN